MRILSRGETGTPGYKAPEMLPTRGGDERHRLTYDEKCDLWSCAMIMTDLWGVFSRIEDGLKGKKGLELMNDITHPSFEKSFRKSLCREFRVPGPAQDVILSLLRPAEQYVYSGKTADHYGSRSLRKQDSSSNFSSKKQVEIAHRLSLDEVLRLPYFLAAEEKNEATMFQGTREASDDYYNQLLDLR